MSTWKVIFATLVIFATGLVVGGLVVNRSVEVVNPLPRQPGLVNANPGQARLQSLLHRMDRELALSQEQHSQVQSIISASQQRTTEIWKPVEQQMSKETQDACEQIRAVLTPDQQAKFDTFPKTRSPDFGQRGERGWRRGGPGPFPGGPSNRYFEGFTNGPRRDSDSNWGH